MSVSGVAELNQALTQTIPLAIMAQLRQGVEESVSPVVGQMKSLCAYDEATPIDRRRHVEHVRDSIRFRWVDPKDVPNKLLGLKLVIIAGSSDTGVLISKARGKRLQLARLIEFGTQKHPARPFFFPIWRAYRRGLKRTLSVRVNRVIAAYSNTSDTTGIAA